MTREYNSVVGSGCTPGLTDAPAYSIVQGTFPVPDQRNSLRNLTGDGVIVLNPENSSVSIGLAQQAISVGGTPTALPSSPLEYRRALVVYNAGPGILYIGASTVTTSNGMPMSVGEKIAFDIQGTPNVKIYGVSDSISDVRILELS